MNAFCITHTHTCVQEEHVREAFEREARRKMCFISEKERVMISNNRSHTIQALTRF